jgi:hypothetical protein
VDNDLSNFTLMYVSHPDSNVDKRSSSIISLPVDFVIANTNCGVQFACRDSNPVAFRSSVLHGGGVTIYNQLGQLMSRRREEIEKNRAD